MFDGIGGRFANDVHQRLGLFGRLGQRALNLHGNAGKGERLHDGLKLRRAVGFRGVVKVVDDAARQPRYLGKRFGRGVGRF